MSYDLFFYTQKDAAVNRDTVQKFLSDNLTSPNANNNQWWYENEDTGVYYSFETADKDDYEDFNQLFESFQDFNFTKILFTLNFLRPDFFGLESFAFVDHLIEELDLWVLNPQSKENEDHIYKPQKNELYQNWAQLNNQFIISDLEQDNEEPEEDNDGQRIFYPLKDCNEIWLHNYNKWQLQAQYKEDFYVPRINLVKTYDQGKIISCTHWASWLSYIIPPTDIIRIIRKKGGLLKAKEESGFLFYDTFLKHFSSYLEDIELPGYKMARPENMSNVSKLLHSISFDIADNNLGDTVTWDEIYNIQPSAH